MSDGAASLGEHFSQAYAQFDLVRFERRARRFQALDLRCLSKDEQLRELLAVITTRGHDGTERVLLPTFNVPFEAGTTFWRVRTLPANEVPTPAHIKSERDLREPPIDRAPLFRFNQRGEPRLYLCVHTPAATFAETNVAVGEIVCLAKFVATAPLNALDTRVSGPTPGIPPSAADAVHRLRTFLAEQLHRPATKGDVTTYEMTTLVAEALFDLPTEVQDAVLYDSTVFDGAMNVAVRPEAGWSKLRLHAAAFIKLESLKPQISTLAYADSVVTDDGLLQWRLPDERSMARLFPELSPS